MSVAGKPKYLNFRSQLGWRCWRMRSTKGAIQEEGELWCRVKVTLPSFVSPPWPSSPRRSSDETQCRHLLVNKIYAMRRNLEFIVPASDLGHLRTAHQCLGFFLKSFSSPHHCPIFIIWVYVFRPHCSLGCMHNFNHCSFVGPCKAPERSRIASEEAREGGQQQAAIPSLKLS